MLILKLPQNIFGRFLDMYLGILILPRKYYPVMI